MTTIASIPAVAGEIASAGDSSDALAPGAMAGPWRVEYELGRGGMGTVYAVCHEEIGKRAALKLMHKRLSSRDLDVDRMLLEAKVVNQARHPNIVDIFETGKLADGRPYIVMERLDGVSLSQRAQQAKLLPDQVIAILRQICEGVGAAHEAGIIHRDLKLDNVFLIDGTRVKILDWGIAKVIDDDIRHTVDGQLVGTPHYLAPEQAKGAAVSAKTDVYSIGVMAYELFLEQLPFDAETAAEIMTMHLRSSPPPPSELWPDIPVSLEVLLMSMLAKSPSARPSTRDVITALDGVLAELSRRRGVTAPARPALAETQPMRTRPWRWRYIGAGAAAAATAIVAMIVGPGDGPAAAAAGTPAPPISIATAPMTPVAAPAAVPIAPAVSTEPLVAVEPPPPVASVVPAVTRVIARPAARQLPPRKAPARAPHRSLDSDPDGTIDAYR